MTRRAPLAEGLTRPQGFEFLAGLHRPIRAPKKGIHAVSYGVVDGARRSVCGILGRFIPIAEDWTGFDTIKADLACEDCMLRFGDESALTARGFGSAA